MCLLSFPSFIKVVLVVWAPCNEEGTSFVYLVDCLHYCIHQDCAQRNKDLPHVVEEHDILGGCNVGDVDIAGHETDGDAGENPGQDEGDDAVRGEPNEEPAEDVGEGGEDEHATRSNDLLEKTSKDCDDDLCIVLWGAWAGKLQLWQIKQ